MDKEQYLEKFEESVQNERAMQKKMSCFIANPLPNLDSYFIPKPSKKPLTEVEEVTLNTDKRFAKRQEFEETMKEREKKMKEMKRK